jgi:hypothetical protein
MALSNAPGRGEVFGGLATRRVRSGRDIRPSACPVRGGASNLSAGDHPGVLPSVFGRVICA